MQCESSREAVITVVLASPPPQCCRPAAILPPPRRAPPESKAVLLYMLRGCPSHIYGGAWIGGRAGRQGLSYACSWHSWRSLKASSSISAASHLVALCFAAQAAALAVHAPLCAHRYENLKYVQKLSNLSDDDPFIGSKLIEDWGVKSGNLAVGLNGGFFVKLNSSTFD